MRRISQKRSLKDIYHINHMCSEVNSRDHKSLRTDGVVDMVDLSDLKPIMKLLDVFEEDLVVSTRRVDSEKNSIQSDSFGDELHHASPPNRSC